MISINRVDRKAGDLAILETMNRMDRAAGEEDIVFRIGGDEFVMLTGREEPDYAQAICEKLRAQNGAPVVFEGRELPLHLHIGAVKFQGGALRYRDLYEQLHFAIRDSKD